MTYYAGAASGGVWKTTDGAKTFEPVFDDQPVQAIGALALAPVGSDNRLGRHRRGVDDPRQRRHRRRRLQVDRRRRDVDEHGVSPKPGRIGRIIVHPTNPDDRLCLRAGPCDRTAAGARACSRRPTAAAPGSASLFADPNTGCSGLSMDAHDPNTLFAGLWQVELTTWVMNSGGPGSAVYVTHDGGVDVEEARRTVYPSLRVGKIDVAVAPSDAKRVYALIQTSESGIALAFR